jgi:hypothetical protein
MDLDLVGQQSEALVGFVPPMSIEDRPLLRTLVRSQTYDPKHILAYESMKTCYSPVMGSGSFLTDCCGGLLGRRSKHHTEAGPTVLGAWSPSLDEDLDPRRVFFRVPSWATLIYESSFLRNGTTWLWSSTVVRTKI